jgi:hypothetical protein
MADAEASSVEAVSVGRSAARAGVGLGETKRIEEISRPARTTTESRRARVVRRGLMMFFEVVGIVTYVWPSRASTCVPGFW